MAALVMFLLLLVVSFLYIPLVENREIAPVHNPD
jgi:hypothetical protein